MKITTLSRKSLTDNLFVIRAHNCKVHGFYTDGIYCEACEDHPDRPHDVWGDRSLRFVVSK